MSWKNTIARRKFLAGLGITSALPFLETFVGDRRAWAQAGNKLKRLMIVSQPHMALGYHRIPEFAKGAFGAADASLLKLNSALGLRVGAFGTDPGKLGGFYEQGMLKTNARLQKEMMVVNGLGSTYSQSQGHQSDGNGSWSGGGQSGKLNTRARFPLSGSLHQTMVTIDNVIAKKIHATGQRSMFMGNSGWGGGGADTNESIDAGGAIQSLTGSPTDLYNSTIFDAGRKITAAQQKLGGGGTTPPPPTPVDPRAAMSNEEFAALIGLENSQQERVRLLADSTLSTGDRQTLEKYYDLLNESLKVIKPGAPGTTPQPGLPGAAVSGECKAPTLSGGGTMDIFLRLTGAAFLCDLSRIGFMSFGSYIDHNTEWHAGADGNSAKVGIFNTLANQVAQVAQSLTTLIDPDTGRDMLETTLVLGITNCALALNTDGRDSSHSYVDFSYFSIGGSAALNTGFMYDGMGYAGGKRPAAGGPVPTVNQYLQTVAAAYGLTAADWGANGFGPWLSTTCHGRTLRADSAAKNSAIPGLLKG